MPSNILTTDTMFPMLTKEQSTDEKFDKITSYLFMLLEQLRYSMGNLDVRNFNDAGFNEIAGIITDPVYLQLEDAERNILNLQITAESLTSRITDAEGNVSTLQQTAKSLTSRITSAEGNVSTLQQTADSLTSRITSAEGNVSTLQQTADSLTSRITSAEGNVSTLQQTAKSLTSRITSAEGNVSTLQQTADSLTSRIKDAEGNVSTLQQTAKSLTNSIKDAEGNISTLQQTVNGLSLSVTNGDTSSTIKLQSGGITMSSQNISFKGIVTFTDLSGTGKTTISGDNITTGTINSIDIEGCTFKTTLASGGKVGGEIEFYYSEIWGKYLAGGIRFDDRGAGTSEQARERLIIYTKQIPAGYPALKLESAGGASMEAGENVFIRAGTMVALNGKTRMTLTAPNIEINGTVTVNGKALTLS